MDPAVIVVRVSVLRSRVTTHTHTNTPDPVEIVVTDRNNRGDNHVHGADVKIAETFMTLNPTIISLAFITAVNLNPKP